MKEIKTIAIEVGKLSNSCFVIMPFGPLFKTEYESIIKPAIVELGLESVRGDEIYTKQRIIDDIWYSIRSSRLVVAELTNRNPNVLYEMGLAHAIGKPVIILTRDETDVPFDLKDLRYLFYDVNDPFWGDNLKKGLQNLIQKVIDNPEIGSYLAGISKIESKQYPPLTELSKEKENKQRVTNLTGIWKANWSPKGIQHDIVLTINQNESEISAFGIITYFSGNRITVVEEVFQGTIVNKTLTLIGANYSYLERGLSLDYGLDNFEIQITNSEKLSGLHIDDKMKLEFTKEKKGNSQFKKTTK